MFCKKNKDDSITAIEQRVCDLENPYKFEIGNEVSV